MKRPTHVLPTKRTYAMAGRNPPTTSRAVSCQVTTTSRASSPPRSFSSESRTPWTSSLLQSPHACTPRCRSTRRATSRPTGTSSSASAPASGRVQRALTTQGSEVSLAVPIERHLEHQGLDTGGRGSKICCWPVAPSSLKTHPQLQKASLSAFYFAFCFSFYSIKNVRVHYSTALLNKPVDCVFVKVSKREPPA